MGQLLKEGIPGKGKDTNHRLVCHLIKSRFTRIFALLFLAMLSIHCAESRLLRKENAKDYRARTYRDRSGAHGYKQIVVFPTGSTGKEYRCHIKPECLKLDKDEEKPEPQDCVDWSEPCEELQ
jgi:hypothetical protein